MLLAPVVTLRNVLYRCSKYDNLKQYSADNCSWKLSQVSLKFQ